MREYGIWITVNDSEPVKECKPFKTPRYLLEMGMCVCDNCGKLYTIDYAFCNDCFSKIMIDVVDKEKPDDAKIMQEIKVLQKRKK